MMTCTQAVLSLLLISPCSDGGGEDMDVAIAEALASPSRPASDREKDELRRPDEVLAFFEIRPGMTVLDLFSGGGYYAEILSAVVGPEGEVVAQNNDAYLSFAGDELAMRFTNGRLENVTRVTAEANDLELPAASFDAALASLTWHDFYYAHPDDGWMAIDTPLLIEKLCSALKPGAVLGVIDHVATSGSDPLESGQSLHRIDPQRIRSDLAGGCFEFEGALNVLRNSSDDHTKSAFDPVVRGKTDQVVLKFRRTK